MLQSLSVQDPLQGLLSGWRRLPLRARWPIVVVLYLVVIALVVVLVRSLTSERAGAGGKAEAKAIAEANKLGSTAIAEDQQPHSARLPTGRPLVAGLEGDVASDVRARITHGELTGPLQRVSCAADGKGGGGVLALRCVVESAGIDYGFDAAWDAASRQLTWCKVDKAPAGDGALEVPVSPRCVR